MMPAGWTHAFINDFHQTVLGLRTAQTGRAYTHLDALLFRLSDQLKHASTKLQHQLLPVVQRMIWAKEQENELLLADIVEYELPLVMPECFIDVSLMTLTTIDDLLTIEEDATELVADAPQIAALRQLYEITLRKAELVFTSPTSSAPRVETVTHDACSKPIGTCTE